MNDEKVRLVTEIETDEAARNLEVLKTELSGVNKELRSMGKYSEEWTEEQKKQYHDLRAEQKELKEEVKDYTRAIDLNDASMSELLTRSRQLQNELRHLKVGSEEWVEKLGEIQQVNTRLHDVREEMNELGGAVQKQGEYWKQFRDDFAATFLAINLTDVIQEVIQFGTESVEMAAEVTDAFADIQKTTGMTADEVAALNDRLQEIDTRTAQEALLEIAKVGGQIGIAGDQMDGFVKSVDMAVVALGDEFKGGAEEVASTLGTLSKLFKETKDLEAGDAINQIGSAINELGSAGSATGPVIAEFAMRMGQLGDLSPQISETMGLGAAFQELGLSAEISAGGLSNILLGAAKGTEEFAAHLGMTDTAFKNLINNNPNEVILRLAESFKGMPTDRVVKELDDLGIKSQEATKVMMLLSDQTDDVTKKQVLSSKAMQEAISLTKEFELKNKNAAAELDKGKKAIDALKVEMGVGLLPIITKVIAGGVAFINTIRAIPAFVRENQKEFAALAIAVLALNGNTIKATASALQNSVVEKARAIYIRATAVAQGIQKIAIEALDAQNKRATTSSYLSIAAEKIRTATTTLVTGAKTLLRTTIAALTIENIKNTASSTANSVVEKSRALITNGVATAQSTLKAVTAALTLENIKSTASAVYHSTIEKGRAIVTNSVTVAQGLLNAVMRANPIGVVITVLAGLAAGLMYVYNHSQTLRAGIAGLWQAMKTAADVAGQFVKAFLSMDIKGMADVMMNGGKKVGAAFTSGYQDTIKAESPKTITEHQKMLDQKTKNTKEAAVKAAKEEADALRGRIKTLLPELEGEYAKSIEKRIQNADKKQLEAIRNEVKEHIKLNNDKGSLDTAHLDETGKKKDKARNDDAAKEKKKAEDEAADRIALESKTRLELEKMSIDAIADSKTRTLALLDFEYSRKMEEVDQSKMGQELATKYMDALHRKLINDKSEVETKYRTEKDTKDKELATKLAANDAALRQAETTAAFDAARAINDFELLAAGDNQKAIFAAKTNRLNLERSAELIQLQDLYNEKMKDLAKRKADDIRTAEESGQETTSIKNRYLELERSATQEFNAKKLGLDTQYQKDQTALHQEQSDARLAKTTDFFGGVKSLMDGDFSYFSNLLSKRKSAETAHENARLKQFSEKTNQIGKAALAGVDMLQKLNQKFLESQLARIDKERNKELSSWEQKYKKGLISKDEYEKGVAKINKDADDKQLAEKKKAFERDKKLQKAQALISGALAFIKALASGFFPLNLVFAAATAVATGLQVAAIGRQQFQAEKGIRTSASHFRNAGIMKGSRHGSRYGDSGISMVDRKTGFEIGEAEDGEAFMILSRNTVKNNGKLIDTLMHSSLHKNGAPVAKVQYRDGGVGSVGWSDYYTPTMMLFGSKKKKAAAAAEAAQAQADAEASAAEAEQEAADAVANYDTGGGGGDYDSDYTGESYSGDDGKAAIAENTKIARDTEGNTRSAAGSLKDIAGKIDRSNQLLEQIAGKPNPPGAGEIGGAVAGAIGSSLRSNM